MEALQLWSAAGVGIPFRQMTWSTATKTTNRSTSQSVHHLVIAATSKWLQPALHLLQCRVEAPDTPCVARLIKGARWHVKGHLFSFFLV